MLPGWSWKQIKKLIRYIFRCQLVRDLWRCLLSSEWAFQVSWSIGHGHSFGHLVLSAHTQGWIKSRKNQNCLAWSSGNFKTVWQGESSALKTVCWFFKYCLLDFINVFLRCKLLYLTPSLKIPSEMEVAPRYNCWHCWHCLTLLTWRIMSNHFIHICLVPIFQ